jgi:phytoene dehydrogenase-like protein
MGAVSDAIAAAAVEAGAEIRTGAPVTALRLRGGRADGVVLDDGSEIRATAVSSSLDPRQTFRRLVGAAHLPPDFVERLDRYRFRGSSAKVNLALDGLPDFTSMPGAGPHLAGAISISPSMDYMEQAYDDAKYGRYSRRPYLDIVIPSVSDSSLAPAGKHVMSCFVQYAPYHLAEGSWDDRRDEFGRNVVDTLAAFAPDLPGRILGMQVVTPLDLERTFGLTEGNIFQGELSLEQLFFNRPVAGFARYRTPVPGLYLCGSAAHPGGGVMGAPGRNASRIVLRDLND